MWTQSVSVRAAAASVGSRADMRATRIPLACLLAAVSVLCDTGGPPTRQLPLPAESWSHFDPLDDVRLLANGLLQLGQSMREFVQKTRAEIDGIFHRLNVFNRSFYQLSALASQIKEEEEELKKTTTMLQTNNVEIRDLSIKISSKVENVLQEKDFLQSRVEGLEEKLSSLSSGLVPRAQAAEINSLRDVIQLQEQSIMQLLEAMAQQSERLDHQRMKISSLEQKLKGSTLVQEAPVKLQSPSATPTPYLTSGTSSTSIMYLPSDCSELFDRGERASGIYAIKPNGSEPFMALCDMSTEHGATVIQRRSNGSVSFDQRWEKYEDGFGDLHGEFWLGLKKIHALASQGNSVLHIQLEDWKEKRRFIQYRFHLGGPQSRYAIQLEHLSANLPDHMSSSAGVEFSTRDRDEPKCAHHHSGGWWLNACGDFNFNGRYFHPRPNGRSERRRGIQWRSGRKVFHSVKFTQISVSPMDPHVQTSAPADVNF